jgi:hypothetical protein
VFDPTVKAFPFSRLKDITDIPQIFIYLYVYSNPILFVAKIPLLFRKQGIGNRE